MKKNAIFFMLTIPVCSVMLTSCTNNASRSSIPTPVITKIPPTHGSINKLLDYAHSSADEEQQSNYLLQVSSILIDQGNESAAKQFLTALPENIPHFMLNRKYLLLSQIALQKHQTSKAMAILAKVNIRKLDRQEFIFFFKISSRAYMQRQDWFNSSISLIKIDKLLYDNEQQYNRQQIFYLLSKVEKSNLYASVIETNNLQTRGWLEVASLYQKHMDNPGVLTHKLKKWQENNTHPITTLFSDKEIVNNPNKEINVALFLPLSGAIGKAGKVIREGFMSALFNYKGNKKYYVKVYDTTSDLSIKELYKQAIANNSTFIVGPLTKENVSQIYSVNKSTENIVLNYPDKHNQYYDHIYQFSLNLTQEAELVAHKAYNEGHRNAFIIWPQDKWGEKLKNSFVDSWQNIGGTIVDELMILKNYSIDKSLVSKLGLTDSYNRKNHLQQGMPKLKFYPKTRQDIDMIFLATNSNSARQLVPLLKFNYANNIPVYATSAIYKGSPKIIRDKDLNQVIFCDMPSILKLPINGDYTEWPEQLNSKERLVNIGYDAFTLMTHLNTLKNANIIGLSLKSGHSYLSENNKIIRNLDWAKFSHGKPITYNG